MGVEENAMGVEGTALDTGGTVKTLQLGRMEFNYQPGRPRDPRRRFSDSVVSSAQVLYTTRISGLFSGAEKKKAQE